MENLFLVAIDRVGPHHIGHWVPRLGHKPQSLSVSLQDEMEIGYIQAPHKTLPVVFDSPRDRGLKDFPVKRVMVGTL